jgi:hypothetical protein
MRQQLHFGLFALALTVVTQADAQDRHHSNRPTTVVVARGGGPQLVRAALVDPRRDYQNQQQDLSQIIAISRQWERATARRDLRAQSVADRRLDAWLEREIRESIREPYNDRYAYRLTVLRDELAFLERQASRGRGHDAYYERKHGHGHDAHHEVKRGHGSRVYYVEKAQIFDELIDLSERQLQRAQARIRYPIRTSLAYR